MDQLLGTHLWLWPALEPEKLSARARAILQNSDNRLFFSSASIWETAIKRGLGRRDFTTDPPRPARRSAHRRLHRNAHHEQARRRCLTLPRLHRDPFDRILIAQAIAQDMQLLTSDALILQYPGPILEA